MPNLVNKPYDPNSGEWFPYNGDESLQDAANTRSRAMYFFHNSLGEVFENQLISFSNEITTADNDDQNGNGDQNGDQSGNENGDQNGDNNGGQNGDAVVNTDDTQSWPILDDNDERIETYSNGDPCYRYRFNANTNGIPTKARFRIWEPVNPTSNDVEIFNRYVAALKTIFSSQTASIQLNNIERTTGSQGVPNKSFWTETGINILPFDGLNFPIYNEAPDNGNNGYNIICEADILSRAIELENADNISRLPDERIGSGAGVNSGVIDWNAVAASTTQRSFRNSDLPGQFIVGEVVENYVFGDYLLLTALGDDAENDLFDQRVVFVRGTSETLVNDELVPAISIETLDDIGFEPQPEGSFIITKLTNAPKLKITYRVNESSATDTETIVATDNEDDV